jgi:hypothetical protein
MADAGTLQELFVHIGYKLDESGQVRAQQGIQQTGTFVQRLQAAFNQLIGTTSEAQKSIAGIAAPAQGALGKVVQETNNAGNQIKSKFADISKSIGEAVRTLAGGAAGGTGGAGGGASSLLQAVGGVGKAFGVIGAGALAASVTAIYALERIGASLDQLQQQAQATGIAAKTIWEMGDATAEAQGRLESLFRRQPGREGQFQDEIRGYIDTVRREMPDADEKVQRHIASLRALRDMPREVAAQYAQIWYGWDEQRLNREIAGEERLIANIERRATVLRAAGLAQDDVNRITKEGGELSDEFAQAWQGIKAALAQVFAALGPPLITIMKAVNALIKVLLLVTSPLVEIGRLIGVILSPINSLFDAVNRGTGIFGALADAVKFVFLPITLLADGIQLLWKAIAFLFSGESLGNLNPLRLLGRAFGALGEAISAIVSPIDLVKGAFNALIGIWDAAKRVAEKLLVPLRPLIWLWEKFQRGRGRGDAEAEAGAPPDQPETLSPREQRRQARREAREARREARRGRGATEALEPAASFQQGGIVNANLHHGEMVLPSRISTGLQEMIAGSRASGPAMAAMQSQTKQLHSQLSAWLAGGVAPKVAIDNIQEFWREFLAAQRGAKQRQLTGAQQTPGGEAAAGAGGAAAGGAGGAAAAGGAAGGGGTAAAAAGAVAAAEGGPLALGGGGAGGGDWRAAPRDWGPAGGGADLVSRAPGTGSIERMGAPGGGGGGDAGGDGQPATAGGRIGRAAGAAVERAGRAIGEAVGGGAPAMARGVIGREAKFNERAGDIMGRLQNELGLTKEQAAGVVGNLAHESGDFKQMQERKPISGRGGLGYGQWTASRRVDFEKFLAERGKDAFDHDANVDFLVQELKTHDNGRTIARLRETTDLAGATRAIHQHYERSADTMAEPGQRYHGRFRPYQSAPERLSGAERAMKAADFGPAPQPMLGEKGRGPVSSSDADPRGLVTQAQAGTRNQKIDNTLLQQLSGAAEETGLQVRVTSGGQDVKGKGSRRTGSTRHDAGGAADIQLIDPKTGRKLDMTNAADQARMGAFLQSSVKRGATGIGAAPGYMGKHTMHVGGGPEGTWGAGGSSRTTEGWVAAAHKGGRAQRKEFAASQGSQASPPVMQAQRGGLIPENLLGGIMPLLAHAGEMVLPRELSQGLQRIIGGEGFGGTFDRPLGGDTFANYNQRQITINQHNNHSWAYPEALQTGRFRDIHERTTGDLVRHFTSAMA